MKIGLLPRAAREQVHGDTRWVYPIVEQVIEGIKAGDAACLTIGVEFIEEDRKFPFGANLKARVARGLRQVTLTKTLATRIRRRVVDMLIAGNVPREFREYVKLLRTIGFDELWPRLEANVPRDNKYVMRYFAHLEAIHKQDTSVIAEKG